MTLFRVDASIREEGSFSRRLGDVVEAEWTRIHPGDSVERRHLGIDPVRSSAWADAVSASWTPAEQRTTGQADAVALAARLADEVLAADALLFAVPLYNYGVSQHFKTWVDLLLTDPRTAPGTTALQGVPAVLATVQGGNYAPGTPKAGWDHATAWMERMLGEAWGMDLRVVKQEFTLVGTNPALDQFTAIAADLARAADAQAAEHGRFLGESVQRAAA